MHAIIADVGAFLAVILIELTLSADTAAVVDAAVRPLPSRADAPALFWGGFLALLLRIVFALIVIDLLRIRGAMLVFGLALLWISFRAWRDLRRPGGAATSPINLVGLFGVAAAQAMLSIDTTLAAAGVARHSAAIMVLGLVVSALIVAIAASPVAAIVQTNRWLGYIAVLTIALTALVMIWDDVNAFAPGFPAPPLWLGGRSEA